MIRAIRLALPLLLAGCGSAWFTAGDPPPAAELSARALPPTITLSAMKMKRFTGPPRAPVEAANADIAEDFLSLFFALESGHTLPVFTRFEGPVGVEVQGRGGPAFDADLDALIARLRREAGIAIARAAPGKGQIVLELVSTAELRGAMPQASCFVVPNVRSLAEYRKVRRGKTARWSLLTQREQVTIVMPSDASPQDQRDCLHEEIAQALGPLNDLYHLENSVFNDDNAHVVLTGFDMLILRTAYAPGLQTGMDRAQVAAKLPAILARLNPGGERRAARHIAPTPGDWGVAVQTVYGPGARLPARRRAARRAVRLAEQAGWNDHRTGFAHYMMGRLLETENTEAARTHYAEALRYFDAVPGGLLRRAQVDLRLAALALRDGDNATAISLLRPGKAAALAAQNASLLSTQLMLEAEALAQSGRPDAARSVRRDSIGWARYGFVSDEDIQARLRAISGLAGPATTKEKS